MCFGLKGEPSPVGTDLPPRRISSESKADKSNGNKEKVKNSQQLAEPENPEFGDSMALDGHSRYQQRLREAYPDGNVPEELKRFRESGMAQGALGGPLGGGAGMAMSDGF